MKNKGHPNNKLQNYEKSNSSHKFCRNNHNSGQFPTGTTSLQASQQIKAGDGISLKVNTIKHFSAR